MNKFREILKKYTMGLLIAGLVFIALVFMPMLDTSGDLGLSFPDSRLGIAAYLIIRFIIGIIVFLIYVFFDMQGKDNIKEDPRYVEAYNLLYSLEDANYIPMSPESYHKRTYGIKALTLALTTTATAFVVMEMVLSYNYVILLTYALSIFTALISGIVRMKQSEIYWTEEFPRYAKWRYNKIMKQNKEAIENGD